MLTFQGLLSTLALYLSLHQAISSWCQVNCFWVMRYMVIPVNSVGMSPLSRFCVDLSFFVRSNVVGDCLTISKIFYKSAGWKNCGQGSKCIPRMHIYSSKERSCCHFHDERIQQFICNWGGGGGLACPTQGMVSSGRPQCLCLPWLLQTVTGAQSKISLEKEKSMFLTQLHSYQSPTGILCTYFSIS